MSAGVQRVGIQRVGIVVPAHDEQGWLGPCLDAVRSAADAVAVPVDVVVVADACSDDTAQVARAAAVEVLEIAARNVGVARAIGWDRLLGRARPATVWLATTDADTLVPTDWLARMLTRAEQGWDAVVGTVAVRDWSSAGRTEAVQAAWLSQYAHAHEHVHGANLGVRGSSYLAVGGVPARALAEDAGLVAALRTAGARVLNVADNPVLTSARFSHRAPGGFASYLDELEKGIGA